ncbi:hypothetical protein Hanom_Chr07g00641081 [Helianthus anomalus]
MSDISNSLCTLWSFNEKATSGTPLSLETMLNRPWGIQEPLGLEKSSGNLG